MEKLVVTITLVVPETPNKCFPDRSQRRERLFSCLAWALEELEYDLGATGTFQVEEPEEHFVK